MKDFARKIVNLLQEEDAFSAIEYAVLLTLVVVICLAGLATLGVEPNGYLRR